MNKIIILMSTLILMTGIVFAVSSERLDKVEISDNLLEKVAVQIEQESIASVDEKIGVVLVDLEDVSEEQKESEEPIIQDSVDDEIDKLVAIQEPSDNGGGSISTDSGELLGDLDGDGDVDKFDLQILLDAWGQCNTKRCIADLDNDRIVGSSDLLILLSNWTGDFTGGFIADLNNDCVVGVEDLLILLGSWGECKDCVADINNDGTVDDKDLKILLDNWGDVPDCGEDDGTGDNGNGAEEVIKPIEFPSSSAWFTKYGWTGQECVKRDLVTKPQKTSHSSFKDPNLRVFEVDRKNFAYRVIKGNRAFGWEPNQSTGFGKVVRERDKICDRTKIETDPLAVTWWRNSHNPELYFQLNQPLTGSGSARTEIISFL